MFDFNLFISFHNLRCSLNLENYGMGFAKMIVVSFHMFFLLNSNDSARVVLVSHVMNFGTGNIETINLIKLISLSMLLISDFSQSIQYIYCILGLFIYFAYFG